MIWLMFWRQLSVTLWLLNWEQDLGAKVRGEAWKPVRTLLPPGKGDADLGQSGSGVGKDGKI